MTLVRQQIEHDGAREMVLDYLHKIRPSMAGRIGFLGAHSWAETPLVRGCSHQYVPGKVVPWSHAMITPHARMHFAGEHTRRWSR